MAPSDSGTTKCNFFLVGAPKAGTTSLDRLLRGHPDVFLSPVKEPCHFCPDVADQLAASFSRKKRLDLDAYLASPARPTVGLAWVRSPTDYARLFEGASGHALVGECSTFYLSSATAAANIHAYNPDAKIVVVLRAPLDRIRSHYEMDRAHGVTNRPLLSLVEEELALGEGADWGNCAYYVGASRYARQLEVYRQRFPAGNICVLSFEALVATPQRELARLFDFVGIPPPRPLVLPSANRSRSARFPVINNALHRSGAKAWLSATMSRALPAHLDRRLRTLYYGRRRSRVSQDDLSRLDALLRGAGLTPPQRLGRDVDDVFTERLQASPSAGPRTP